MSKRRRGSIGSYLLGVALAVGSMLGATSTAVGAVAGVTLSRAPAPPQAVRAGQIEQINYEVRYETRGISAEVRILTPAGVPLLSRTDLIGDTSRPPAGTIRTFGAANPLSWVVPAGAPSGRYSLEVRFTSDIGAESSAIAAFDVAAELGRIETVAYEDLNGNGVRDAGELGLKDWLFDLTNPFGGGSGVSTSADGSAGHDNVPAGSWNVKEALQAGWVATSPVSGTVVVPANGTGTFSVGQVRPGAISGTVFMDANRNGIFDAGETVRAGATVTLSGQSGTGQSVSRQAVSGTDGTYRFADLLPGTYGVSASSVTGLEYTSRQSISGITLQSGGDRPRVDFGLAPQTTTPPGTPTTPTTPTPPRLQEGPALVVKKTGPATAKGGQTITYRITVRNTGGKVARNVVVSDPIPNLMTLVGSPANARILNGVVTWRVGDIAPGRRVNLTMRVRIAAGAPAGVYANTATATSDNASPTRSTTALRVPTTPAEPPTGGVTG